MVAYRWAPERNPRACDALACQARLESSGQLDEPDRLCGNRGLAYLQPNTSQLRFSLPADLIATSSSYKRSSICRISNLFSTENDTLSEHRIENDSLACSCDPTTQRSDNPASQQHITTKAATMKLHYIGVRSKLGSTFCAPITNGILCV